MKQLCLALIVQLVLLVSIAQAGRIVVGVVRGVSMTILPYCFQGRV